MVRMCEFLHPRKKKFPKGIRKLKIMVHRAETVATWNMEISLL